MSPLDREIPAGGEEIHLPGPTPLPLVLTVGLTLTLIGVTTNIVLVVAGALLSLFAIGRWIADTRHDIGELSVHEDH